MATPANTTTRPAILPQSVIENCRRNANELCERLAALDPNRTDVVLRKAWNKSTNLNKPRYLFDPEKINNAQAVLAHLAGRVVKEDECISCAHGHGPFTECVRILMRETDRDDFIFMGACTNCRIGGEQSYCSLAQPNEDKIPAKAFKNNRHVPESKLEEMRENGEVIDEPKPYEKRLKLVHGHDHRPVTFPMFYCSTHSSFYEKMSSTDPVSEVAEAGYLAQKKAFIEKWRELNMDGQNTRYLIQAKHALHVLRSYFGTGTIPGLLLHGEGLGILTEENGVKRDMEKHPNKLTFQQAQESDETMNLVHDRSAAYEIIKDHSLFEKLDDWEQKDVKNALMFYYDKLYTNLVFRLLGLKIKFPVQENPEEDIEDIFGAFFRLLPRLGCDQTNFMTQDSKAGSYTFAGDISLFVNNARNFEQLLEELRANGFLEVLEDDESIVGLENQMS